MQYRSVERDTTSEESASPLMNSNAHPKSRSSKTQQSRRQTLMFQTRTSSESTGKKVVHRTKPPRQDVRTTIIKMAPPTIISAERKLKVLRALQMADRKQRMKDEFSTFCTDTSFTAIVRIYNATSSRIRLFWSVLFLIMFVWMTVQCYWLLEKYFTYPVEVKIDLLAAKELEFPSVTVCNLNPLKQQMLQHNDFKELQKYTDTVNNGDVLYGEYNKNWDLFHPKGLPDVPNSGKSSASELIADTARRDQSVTPLGTSIPDTATIDSGQATPPSARRKRTVSADKLTHMIDFLLAKQAALAQPNQGLRPIQEQPQLSHQRNNDTIDGTYSTNHLNAPVTFSTAEDELKLTQIPTFELNQLADRRKWLKRRDIEVNRTAVMRSNSFNKWDTLNSKKLNLSYYVTRGSEYKAAMAYATIAARLDVQRLQRGGHSADNLILNCWFNGYQCSPRNFSYFHSYKYGSCYTFNSHSFAPTLKTKFPGPEHGLTLEMYIQQNEYIPALAAEAGVRIVIHPKGSVPFPEDNGFSVPPGRSTSISMSRVDIVSLEPPHGTCSSTGNDVDLYAMHFNTSYSKLSCLKSCYQSIVFRHCNCSVPMFFVQDNGTVCNMTEDAVDDCQSNLPGTHPEEYDECDRICPQPCFETKFDIMASAAAWPSGEYRKYMMTKMKQTNYLLMDTIDVDSDFVKVNIYYTDLIYQKIEQQKAYESENLLSDIGGQLGLWLGLSAITLGELCELILSLCQSLTSSTAPSTPAVQNRKDNSTNSPIKPSYPDLTDVNGDLLVDVKDGFM